MTDQEKAELAGRTLMGFFHQFGDDFHAQILLEELFKGLMYEEAVFVLGKPVEAGDEAGDDLTERVDSDIPSDGPVEPEAPGCLATPDLPDYP